MRGLPLLGRLFCLILAVLGTFRLGIGLYAFRAANKLEQPSYSVIRRLPGGVELRRYTSYNIAETVVKASSMREGSGKGFRNVAGYIFGKNKPRMKMKMTAPVRMAKSGGAAMAMTAPVRVSPGASDTRVSFVLERQYTTSNAPAPLNRDVRVRQVSSHVLAARRFSGPPPAEKRVEREKNRIIAALEAHGLRPSKGGPESTLVYGYRTRTARTMPPAPMAHLSPSPACVEQASFRCTTLLHDFVVCADDPFITPSFLRRNEVCVRVEDCEALRV